MVLLFGVVSEAAPPGADVLRRALSAFPTIRAVQHHVEDACFLAVASQQERLPSGIPARLDRGRLVFDGWLANRNEISHALNLPVNAGDIRTDAEIVGVALDRWGAEALPRFHGDFSIVWWRPRERRLLLACDRTGGCPLFYHASEGRLVFANLVSAIFACPDIPRSINPDMVAAVGLAPQFQVEDTCFAGVRQLLPGFRLDWSPARGVEVARYWQLDLSRRIRLRRDEEYVEAARGLLDTVVGEACRVEGPLVTTLSGGLDSTAVAATAARLTAPRRLHAITLSPDPSISLPAPRPRIFQDEWEHAQAVARMYPSMQTHRVEASMDGLEETLRTGFFWMGRPPVHLQAPIWMRGAWRRAHELGARTILVGQAGNGTLSASALPAFLRPGLRDWPAALHAAALAASLGRPAAPFIRALAPGWVRTARDRLMSRGAFWQTRSGLTADAGARIGAGGMWDTFFTGDSRVSLGRRARLRTIETTWMGRTTTAGLRFRDRIDRRDPLGDVRLAEFCLAIPSRQFTRFGHDRHLARRVLADRLPPEVVNERRVGRQNAEWFGWATSNRAWMAGELGGIDASPLGPELIDVPRLRRILERWPADADAAEPRYQEIMGVLGRGVALGGFVKWAEGRNQ